MSESAIKLALDKVIDPELRLPITELDMVAINVENQVANVTVKLTVAGCPAAQKIEADVKAAVADFDATVTMSVMNQTERDALKAKLRNGKAPRQNPFDADTLTRVYLVGSGKGGVGKSSLTANLAVTLADQGFRVGLVDADIFGFSIPGQLGITDKPTRVDEMILPPVAFGVKVISIGMFLDENKPVAWRGPMLHRAIEQFLCDVYWGDLDFLLIDMPPGTGDVAISLGQLLPTAKTIVVTTPQLAAAEVAERSGAVGLQTGQSIFGVIENMSSFPCPKCGEPMDLFGIGGGSLVAEQLTEILGTSVPLLGKIPFDVKLREGGDSGHPLVLSDPEAPASQAIRTIAEQLGKRPRGLAGLSLGISSVRQK
jgi:ATP-binding protein involved in chromosome partitioning